MLVRLLFPEVAHLWFNRQDSASLTSSCLVLILAPLLPFFLEDSSSLLREYLTFYAILTASVVTYRISPIHPLAKYPGPLPAKITKFWGVWIGLTGRSHTYRQGLHKRYGPIVRVGPNEVSIIDKDIIPHVLGSQGMPRGPLWDGRRFQQHEKGYDNLIDVRSNEIHHQLRKAWNRAFTAEPVKDYQELLVIRGKQLRSCLRGEIEKEGGKSAAVDLAKWLSAFAFDFMGDLAFGGCFELMKEGDVEGIWQIMEDGLVLPSLMQHIPWLLPLVASIPLISAQMATLGEFAVRNAKRRLATETKQKDLFHHLYEVNYDDPKSKVQLELASSEAVLTVVAGSDTTATTLTAAICGLMSHPDVYARLKKEVDDAFANLIDADGAPEIELEKLVSLPYLNAVLNESLRLVPAVPTFLQRAPAKGSGGKLLGDTNIFIPEGVAVDIAPYTLHRDERYFSPDPESFIPDRWLSGSENSGFTTNREAYIPFSYGPANCAGKPLALVELRYVIALLVQNFELSFPGLQHAPVETLAQKEREWMTGLRDHFVFSKPPLKVRLVPRW